MSRFSKMRRLRRGSVRRFLRDSYNPTRGRRRIRGWGKRKYLK